LEIFLFSFSQQRSILRENLSGGTWDLAPNGGAKRKGRKEKERKGKKGKRAFRVPSGETSFGIVHD
jgi:hypothetical protein